MAILGAKAARKAVASATRGVNAGAAAILVIIATGAASRVNMRQGLLASALAGVVDTILAEAISGFDEETGAKQRLVEAAAAAAAFATAAAIAIAAGIVPAVGGIAAAITVAVAELAAIGAAASATYNSVICGVITFLAGAAAISLTFIIYRGITKTYGM